MKEKSYEQVLDEMIEEDKVNNPSHYQGKFGLEAIDVVRNFAGNLTAVQGFYWGNAIKYLLRFQGKNGLEDLKKARKNLDWLIEEYEKLTKSEPQKPVVPQYIADFIAEQKKHGLTLSYSIDASMSDGVAEWYWDNPELFARAWLDGYTVEKEKRYLVKMKNVLAGSSCLIHGHNNEWYYGHYYDSRCGVHHTRKELEEAGFDWVFSCEGIEVQEVE